MSDPLDMLVSRLDKVREVKPGHFEAACPAYDDRNPSLSLTRGDDGRALVHCWSGCGAAEIVQAVGLTLADLFVRDERAHQTPTRNRQYPNYKKILKLLRHEIEVLRIAAHGLKYLAALSSSDFLILERAYQNISRILRASNV